MTAAETTVHTARDGIRETLDSIIVALILAFVFRAFVVEAFIIPTGSMAPTLYGAHGTILCEDCGTEFAYGLRDLADPRESTPVRSNSEAVCPNCRHVNNHLRVNDEARNPESGDRILVLKWPLDTLLSSLSADRWDVTVFKDPQDGETNFIKRLVGLPNEVLMILDGDVYTVPADSLSAETRAEMERIAAEKHTLLEPDGLKAGTFKLRNKAKVHSAGVLGEVYDKLKILRKAELAQRVLWFPVYDDDYHPQKLDAGQPRWIATHGATSGWTVGEGHIEFKERGTTNDSIVLGGERLLLAKYAYNIYTQEPPEESSDLRTRFVLTPETASGGVKIRLSKWGRVFWGTVQFDGQVSIVEKAQHDSPSGLTLTARIEPLRVGVPVEISFEHLDYRLALKVGDREVLATSDDSKSSAYYAPTPKSLRGRRGTGANPPQIHAIGGEFNINHMVVERDIHYYHTERETRDTVNLPPGGWGSEDDPILLRSGEYFMLGDNTAASKDSRLWDRVDARFVWRGKDFQLGTVPEDQLIGRAFFVYWPSGRRFDWWPSLKFGIIPDVGRMRWIR